IDEGKAAGMAVTRERKLHSAERSYRHLTETYGVAEEDIIFDPLVFPVGTGDQNYVGAGAETVEGVRLIKEALPRTKTILGISNVSFGLPMAGREVLNSVFLHHCVRAGLDLAIVNAPLMTGMDEVGRLFNNNDLIVAEVLQSAEAMKAAVAHLEPFMEKTESATKGTVLLATVKGDVHDIGKNLVEIILGNNG